MAESLKNYPLLTALMHRWRISWFWKTLIIAALLLLLLILVTYLDGIFSSLSDWNYWRGLVVPPIIIIYILSIYPFVQRLWEKAILAFQPLLPEDKRGMLTMVKIPNRRREWIAVTIGFIFWLALARPWSWINEWIEVYSAITTMLMFVILSWLIYGGLSNTRRINKLGQQNLNLDIFNTGLVPVANYSMGITFAFIGGISLSMIFQSMEKLLEWQNVVIYSILIVAMIIIFFLSMWSTHEAIAKVKRYEHKLAKGYLEEVTHKLRAAVTNDHPVGMEKLYSAVAAWGIYERRIRDTSEWPYNTDILRRLFASLLIPCIVYLLKVLFNINLNI